jgi:hypothetical protein
MSTNVYFELKTKDQCLLKTIKIYRYFLALLSRLLSKLNRLIHGQRLAQKNVWISVALLTSKASLSPFLIKISLILEVIVPQNNN